MARRIKHPVSKLLGSTFMVKPSCNVGTRLNPLDSCCVQDPFQVSAAGPERVHDGGQGDQ